MRMYTEETGLNILSFHHVGLLVESIEDSIVQYAALFGSDSISNITTIESQKVKVCFVKISEASFIELVQPTDNESVVYKLLKKRMNYYHMGYKVSGIESAVDKLEKLNYKRLQFFNSEAFEGKRCIFLFTPDAYLIELIEE
jgi:methylmalonyl-CoA/ethylmalonyl-CoA epimerase